jgi:PhoPQ-activated pathogenicity-related protein
MLHRCSIPDIPPTPLSLPSNRFAFAPYCEVNITTYFNTPAIAPLAALIDPLGYAANLTMPKLVIDACGDEFFQLDDDAFWWGSLPGETYRAMIPDAEHLLVTGLPYVLESLSGFYVSVLQGSPRPQLNWTIDETTGVIDAWTDTQPSSALLWFATTIQDQRRDFRLLVDSVNGTGQCPQGIPVDLMGQTCLVPVIWVSEAVTPYKNDSTGYYYSFSQPLPPTGWRGFLGDFTFPGPSASLPLRFTTQASTIPNTRPFGPCPAGCPCQLV